MTTDGGIPVPWILNLSDEERMWWLQQCVEHNERIEEEMERIRDRR